MSGQPFVAEADVDADVREGAAEFGSGAFPGGATAEVFETVGGAIRSEVDAELPQEQRVESVGAGHHDAADDHRGGEVHAAA